VSSLSRDKSGNYHVHFRFGGRQHHKSLKTSDLKTAEGMKGRLDLTLRDLELGRLVLPPAPTSGSSSSPTARWRTNPASTGP
jgi:hypothetical protein